MLGAGATLGASTSEEKICKPPLNADFFTQLQRIETKKHRRAVSGVIDDVVGLFGANFDLPLEEYFTQLESMRTVAKLGTLKEGDFTITKVKERRDRLMTALAAVLEESTDVSRKDSDVCEYHARLVRSLAPQDSILSFNYDCVMDHALRKKGKGKWSARYGYCFPAPSRVEGVEHWDAPEAPSKPNSSVNLLKLHGSLNWQLPASQESPKQQRPPIKLKQRLYMQNGTPRFTIIPPEFVKNIDRHPVFRVLWRRAERAIRSAKEIALVGFSFTPTDLHVEALFRMAASAGSISTLVIANPSRQDRKRIRSVFGKALERRCIVRQYESLEDYADALKAQES